MPVSRPSSGRPCPRRRRRSASCRAARRRGPPGPPAGRTGLVAVAGSTYGRLSTSSRMKTVSVAFTAGMLASRSVTMACTSATSDIRTWIIASCWPGGDRAVLDLGHPGQLGPELLPHLLPHGHEDQRGDAEPCPDVVDLGGEPLDRAVGAQRLETGVGVGPGDAHPLGQCRDRDPAVLPQDLEDLHMDVVELEADADPSRLTASTGTISGNFTHSYPWPIYIRLSDRTAPGRSAGQSSASSANRPTGGLNGDPLADGGCAARRCTRPRRLRKRRCPRRPPPRVAAARPS